MGTVSHPRVQEPMLYERGATARDFLAAAAPVWGTGHLQDIRGLPVAPDAVLPDGRQFLFVPADPSMLQLIHVQHDSMRMHQETLQLLRSWQHDSLRVQQETLQLLRSGQQETLETLQLLRSGQQQTMEVLSQLSRDVQDLCQRGPRDGGKDRRLKILDTVLEDDQDFV